MHAEQHLEKLLQFGFAAVMAFCLLYAIYRIVTFNTKATKDMYMEHKRDMARKDDDHREERKEALDTFEKTVIRITKQ